MHGIYSLEDRLCEELEELGLKEKWDAGDLEIVDRLAHALKNTEKILDHYENNGYSGRMFDEPMYYPYNGRTRGGMYARNGGYSRARRYERSGRYSRDGGYSMADSGMIDEFRDLMMDVQDEGIKKDIKKIIEKLENM